MYLKHCYDDQLKLQITRSISLLDTIFKSPTLQSPLLHVLCDVYIYQCNTTIHKHVQQIWLVSETLILLAQAYLPSRQLKEPVC